jgi:transposase
LCYIFKYAHSQRHNDIKQIISNEEIEEYVDPWTKKYVQNHIMPKFSSWLNAIEALYLKEFHRKTVSLGALLSQQRELLKITNLIQMLTGTPYFL